MVQIKQGPFAKAGTFLPNRYKPIEYIVMHYDANKGATDEGNANFFAKINTRDASAHYFVDEDSITCSVKDTDVAWHCGTSGDYYHPRCRNSNSIGIELCSDYTDTDGYFFTEKTLQNGRDLVRMLMDLYNIPIENVVRHYDVTHKPCPLPWVNNPEEFEEFKNSVVKLTEVIEQEDEEEMDQAQFNKMYQAMLKETHGDAPSKWAEKACKKAQEKGVFNGDGKGNYDWQEPITRESVCVILDNMGLLD